MTKSASAKKRHQYPKGAYDRLLLFIILSLTVYGSLMIFSASTAYASIRFADTYYFVKRQAMWVTLGIFVMLAVSRVPLLKIKKYVPHLFGIALFFLLLVPIF